MSLVLGIDLGSNSGWASFDLETRSVEWGWNQFSKLEPVDRVTAFGEWLQRMLLYKEIRAVGFELVNFSGPGRGSEFITRQEGVLQWLCRGVAWQGVNVMTLKVFATGDGRADKKAMVHAARYGLRVLGAEQPEKLHHDEADAILVLCWVLLNSIEGFKL